MKNSIGCSFVTTILLSLGFVPAALAADNGPNPYFASKSQVFFQTSASGAVPDPISPFAFSVASPTAATLQIPGGRSQALTFSTQDGGSYGIDQTFTTKAAMDAAWPSGTYTLTGSGVPTFTLNLNGDLYPTTTPQVTNGTWNAGGMLVINPAQSYTVNLSTFSSYATGGVAGHMDFHIDSNDSGDGFQQDIVSKPAFGLPQTATPFTSVTIPANTLVAGQSYFATVNFDTATTLDTVTPGGAVALFQNHLSFYIAAIGNNTAILPAPVIVTQPTNQSGPLGGSATFSAVFNFGNTNGQFVNSSIRWYFNGQEINPDGSKLIFNPTNNGNGSSLTVRNITAADVGTYYLRIRDIGGVVTTAPATLSIGAATTAPSFTLQPFSYQFTSGSTIVLNAAATGATSFQWRKLGQNIPGATSSSLVLSNATAADAATYSVLAINSAGNTASNVITLGISNNPDFGRVSNLSVSTDLSASAPSFKVGTYVGGGGTIGPKPIVIRVSGPNLARVVPGFTGFTADPKLELFSGPTSVANNDNWETGGATAVTAAFNSIGAAPFGGGSKDAALFIPALAQGSYSVEVSAVGTPSGLVVAELFDASPNAGFAQTTPRIVNLSVYKRIEAGGSLTAGFFINGATPRTVLIRAIGPTLGTAFGFGDVMSDPQLTLFNSNQGIIAQNDNWGGDQQIVSVGERVSAFAISNRSSADAMILITLPPGGYSARATGVGSSNGNAIIEVYEVP